MRISDWSSDVCSSDLALRVDKLGISGCRSDPATTLRIESDTGMQRMTGETLFKCTWRERPLACQTIGLQILEPHREKNRLSQPAAAANEEGSRDRKSVV